MSGITVIPKAGIFIFTGCRIIEILGRCFITTVLHHIILRLGWNIVLIIIVHNGSIKAVCRVVIDVVVPACHAFLQDITSSVHPFERELRRCHRLHKRRVMQKRASSFVINACCRCRCRNTGNGLRISATAQESGIQGFGTSVSLDVLDTKRLRTNWSINQVVWCAFAISVRHFETSCHLGECHQALDSKRAVRHIDRSSDIFERCDLAV